MENKIPVRFFVVTFVFSWLLWGLAILIGHGSPQDNVYLASGIVMAIMLIGAFGPAVGAFVSVRSIEGKGSIKTFCKRFLSLKFGWKVWLSIFLISGLSYFVAWIIPELFGEERISSYLPNFYIFPLYLILMIFFGGGQEEIGWRGYILPYLEKRYGLIFGSLILGIIWAIWHIPLWFIPGSTQTYMNFIAFTFMTIGYSYFFHG
ncbi:CPBP family intramembrane metalloprotease [Brucepastera parasyntrophica]|uniref:CPBP family intramembrane glutamic endopeptidase n=1 Tax=Brucepastera parasyntrophica TaxID=2880008 RepID=UPI00210D6993|nr:type II CAAX endopeptidase family protein [Brucepastera parasyntrophica]ULQ60536.1 CPBP family intramembrane metalloprotease [Brucepastera parasyntrophica]